MPADGAIVHEATGPWRHVRTTESRVDAYLRGKRDDFQICKGDSLASARFEFDVDHVD